MTPIWWAEPTAGEIVWRHFPDNINPRPKPGPALILAVFDDDTPQFHAQVVYGANQRTTTLHSGEFRSCVRTMAGLRFKAGHRPALYHRVVLGTARRLAWPDTQARYSASLLGAGGLSRISRGD